MDSAAPNPSPDPSIDAPPDGLRAAILSGRFAGAADRGLASDLTRFLTGPADAAVPLWFGAERLTKIAHNPASLRGLLDHDIAAIDALISAQLDAILHHPRTLRLEGTWRGVAWLTGQMTPDANVKVKLFNATWREIGRDLEYAIEFDQSHMFRHIYEADFGTAGGEPIGLVLVDQPVRHLPSRDHPVDDKLVLERLAAIGAAAFAPVLVAPAPDLLGVDSFAQLADQTDQDYSSFVAHLLHVDQLTVGSTIQAEQNQGDKNKTATGQMHLWPNGTSRESVDYIGNRYAPRRRCRLIGIKIRNDMNYLLTLGKRHPID